MKFDLTYINLLKDVDSKGVWQSDRGHGCR